MVVWVVIVGVVVVCAFLATFGGAAALPQPAARPAITKLMSTDRFTCPAFSSLDASHATNTPWRSG